MTPMTRAQPLRPLRRRSRRGSAYLLVLGGALLLATAGMGAIYASGVRRASGELQVEAWKARLAAEAGIEAALNDIKTITAWRTSKTSGNWYTGRPTGDGAFAVDVTDSIDGNLANNPGDPVDIIATGTAGRGRSKLKVSLIESPVPYSALGAVLCTGGAQTHTGTTIVNDQLIHSNGPVTAVAANISGNVDAVLNATGVTFTGTARSLVAARDIPAPASLMYYYSVATTINRASLPKIGSTYYLERLVLSPASNPYGATNSMGIYVIDAASNVLVIRDCRIVGTLIVVNAGGGSQVGSSVNMAPAVPNYPVLLVDGNFELRFDSPNPLNETSATTNFNPLGTPYASVADIDQTDSYPCEIRGLVYILGNLTTAVHPKVVGNLICTGVLSTSGSLTLSYSPVCFSAPPPGFARTPVPMKVIAGSWQQLVD